MKKLFTILIMLAAMNASAQWVKTFSGALQTGVSSFAVSGTNIFAGTYKGVYLSTNNGINWTYVNGDFPYTDINTIAVLGSSLFAGTNVGIYISTNNGVNWSTSALMNKTIFDIKVFGTNIFAGTDWGVYASQNYGASWILGLSGNYIHSLTSSGAYVYAASEANGVYFSTNIGSNWVPINNGIMNSRIYGIAASGTNLYVASRDSGVFLSTNNGSTWKTVNSGLPNHKISHIGISGTNVFASGDTACGVFLSTNNGANWLNKNQGFNVIPFVYEFLITNNYILVGTSGQSIWRRSFTDIIGIQSIGTEIPSKYSLSQNYPNPFNPITNVKFSIVKTGDVKLVVYDIQGREVQTLVNERLDAGTYETTFDGSMLPSGVYFYKLTAGDFSETKRLTLLK